MFSVYSSMNFLQNHRVIPTWVNPAGRREKKTIQKYSLKNIISN